MCKLKRTRIEFDKLPEIAAPKIPRMGTIKKLKTMFTIDAINNILNPLRLPCPKRTTYQKI